MASTPAEDGLARASTRSRVSGALLGPRAARRLTLTHALDDVADSLINLSLVGSLFFSVSLEASRSRILLYLVLTAAPLALVAPIVGPLLDRLRAGYRSVVLTSQLARVLLALGLASSLLSLAFYPLVFGVLLARKAYALAKTAMLAQLVTERDDLVVASGHLARTGTVTGGLGTALGGVMIATVGVVWLPVVAAVVYLLAALATIRIPRVEQRRTVAAAVVRAETPPEVRQARTGVAALRAAAGALTFLLALAIKRGGGDEWIFAAALVGAGVGVFLGTLVSPRLHRRLASDRVVLLALMVPGVVSAFGVLTIGSLSIVAIAFTIGLAGSVASRSMDALYGRVPDLVRGRVIARTELGFQTANLGGAIIAVSTAPSPRMGFAVVAVVLLIAGVGTASTMRVSLRHEAGRWLLGGPAATPIVDLPDAILAEALQLAERGECRLAIVLADSAVRVADARSVCAVAPSDAWCAFSDAVDGVVTGRVDPDAALAVAVVQQAATEVAVLVAQTSGSASGSASAEGVDTCSGSPDTTQPSST